MSKITSIFGVYAERLQVVIDSSLDKFAPTWFLKYFPWGPLQSTLTYVSVIGKSRIEAAASVVDRDAASPLRARAVLDKLSGEIPAMSQKFPMNSGDYYDYEALNAMQGVSDSLKMQETLNLMFNDVKKAGVAPLKRLDILCLQAVSSGKIKIDANTNPDGLVLDDIDLLMPSGNKVNANTAWSNIAAKPLTVDIPAIITAAQGRGIKLTKMLMHISKWYEFIKITEVINYVSNFLNRKQTGTVLVTLENVNAVLEANLWPPIEIVNEIIGVEKDGVISQIQPWDATNVSFIPDGPLGVMKNAIAIEQRRPVPQVTYGTYERVLISKWAENDPFLEYTKCELNAFPAFEGIDSVFLLSTTIAF